MKRRVCVCETLLSSVWCCPFLRKEIDPPFFFVFPTISAKYSPTRLGIEGNRWQMDGKGHVRLFKVFDPLTCCWEIVSNSFVSRPCDTLLFSVSLFRARPTETEIFTRLNQTDDEVTWEQGRALRCFFLFFLTDIVTISHSKNNNSNPKNTGPPYITKKGGSFVCSPVREGRWRLWAIGEIIITIIVCSAYSVFCLMTGRTKHRHQQKSEIRNRRPADTYVYGVISLQEIRKKTLSLK